MGCSIVGSRLVAILSFSWVLGTDLGKKARMKMPRKMTVFLVLVSKGI